MNIKLTKKSRWIFVLTGITAIALGVFFMPKFLSLVEFLGHRIPQNNVRLDYLKGVLWSVLLGASIFCWPIRSSDKKAVLLVWLVKCAVMLGFMLFYEYYYQTDAFGYFSGSMHDISEWKKMEISGPSSAVVIIAWLHNHTFFNSFHATKVSFGMIGLVAAYIFYRAVVAFLRQEKVRLLYVFALFPSILFWSSTLGKEAIVFLGIAIYSFGAINWFRNKNLLFIFVMLCGVMLVTYMRVWMGVIMVLPVLMVSFFIGVKKMRIKIAATLILISACLFFARQVSRSFNVKSTSDFSAAANLKSTNFSRGGSMVNQDAGINSLEKTIVKEAQVKETADVKAVKEIASVAPAKKESAPEIKKTKFNNLWDMLFFLPQGMFTVLFRPLPGEVNNIFGLFSGLEDAFLLILFALALKRARWRELLSPIPIWSILLIVIWAAAYSFVGFNLGTVCRYRLQILPIFLGLLLYLSRNRDILINNKNK